MDMFAAEAAARGITMEVEPGEPVEMLADAERDRDRPQQSGLQRRQVQPGRRLGARLPSVARAGGVKISVADTGIGLSPDEAAKLFTEFVRIKNEDTVKILGSGLGLSTVRKLAQLYGGDATVESKKGEGSVFTVTLNDATPAPAREPAPARADQEQQKAGGPSE